MRNRCNVFDGGDFQPDRLQSPDRRFSARTRTFDADFNFLHAVRHGLARRVLRDLLRRISGAFARTFEANLAGARPPDHVAFHVSDRHDGVVERRKHMRDARVNVLTALGLDDLWLLDLIR